MKDDINTFAQATRSKVTRGLWEGSMGFGGKFTDSILDMFKYEMLTIPPDFPSGSKVKNLPAMQETWVEKIPWRRK